MKATIISIILLVIIVGCSANKPQADTLPTILTGVDSNAFLTIPSGVFYLGQHDVETDIGYDYDIMVTHVTNAQYSVFLNDALTSGDIRLRAAAVVGTYPGDTFNNHKHEIEIKAGDWIFITLGDPALRLILYGETFSPKSGFENHPMTLVSWFGAWGYCQYYGWRLPTDIEWEKAARGTDNRPYPWGNEINQHYANYVSSNDIFERMFSGAGGTTPVGFYNGHNYQGFQTSDNASPYGIYDMAGNVWQWTGDVRTGVHYRNLRGGSHLNYAYNLRIWTHNNADPIYTSPSVGFRCVKDR